MIPVLTTHTVYIRSIHVIMDDLTKTRFVLLSGSVACKSDTVPTTTTIVPAPAIISCDSSNRHIHRPFTYKAPRNVLLNQSMRMNIKNILFSRVIGLGTTTESKVRPAINCEQLIG